MAQHKSAEKRNRQNVKRRERNAALKARMRTAVKAAREAISSKGPNKAEVVKAAELRAAQIVEDAEANARRLRLETEDYCDQKLASFENVLARIHKTVVAGRSRLAAPTLEESELGDLPDAPTGSTGAVPVFDQDQ